MAGRLDVDRLMDELTPEEFDQWLAYRQIEPDPADRLIEIVKRGLFLLCNSWGARVKLEELDPGHVEPNSLATPNQAVAILGPYLDRLPHARRTNA